MIASHIDIQTIKASASGRAIAQAFNAWMDDYIKDPERFEKEQESIARHLTDIAQGKEPSYGEMCAATLQGYIDRVGGYK